MVGPKSEVQTQWPPDTSSPSNSSHSRTTSMTTANPRSIQISMPWPTESLLEEWYLEVFAAADATTPRIVSAVRSLSLAVTSDSIRRNICERCKQDESGLKRLTQMLIDYGHRSPSSKGRSASLSTRRTTTTPSTTSSRRRRRTTDKLVKKRIPSGPGPNPEQPSSPDGNTVNVQDELQGVFSDSDAEATMEAGENAPLQEGSSDPHGPNADRASPGKYPETEDGIEEFRYAIYKETDEAAGINLWKNQFSNTDERKYSAGDLPEFFGTTPDRLTLDNYGECKNEEPQNAEQTPPGQAPMDFPRYDSRKRGNPR